MSSFIWPPDAGQLASGAPQTFEIGQTFTGLIFGGASLSPWGVVYVPAPAGFVLGGDGEAVAFHFFLTYPYVGDGGLVLGGEGKLPARFVPDPDFPGPATGIWTDDITFPGEAIGGD